MLFLLNRLLCRILSPVIMTFLSRIYKRLSLFTSFLLRLDVYLLEVSKDCRRVKRSFVKN